MRVYCISYCTVFWYSFLTHFTTTVIHFSLKRYFQLLFAHISIKSLISRIYHDHKGRYVYRRITLLLKRYGMAINHKAVLKLMEEMKLRSLIRVKKYRSYRGDIGKIAPNILNRDFKADRPYQKWATDVTEFKVKGRKLYLS